MPRRTELSLEDLKSDWQYMRKLTMPIEEVEKAVKEGAKLTLEETVFSDPSDYIAIFLSGRDSSIVYIPGY